MRLRNITYVGFFVLILASVSLAAEDSGKIAAKDKAAPATRTKTRYKLVAGMGYTVCERYVRMLNAFPSDAPPMICEQKLHQNFPDFAFPQWEPLDVLANLELVLKLEQWLYGQGNIWWSETEPVWKGKRPTQAEWLAEIERRIHSGESKPRLRRTELAFVDDRRERLLAYTRDTGQCARDLATYRSSYKSWEYLFLYGVDGQVELKEPLSFNADGSFSAGRHRLNLLGGREQVVFHNRKPYVITTFASFPPPPELEFHLRPASPYSDPDDTYVFPDRCIVRINIDSSNAR